MSRGPGRQKSLDGVDPGAKPRYGVRQKLKQFADIVYRFWLQTIKIWKFRTIHLLILDQYVSRWGRGLSDICLGLGPLANAWRHHWVTSDLNVMAISLRDFTSHVIHSCREKRTGFYLPRHPQLQRKKEKIVKTVHINVAIANNILAVAIMPRWNDVFPRKYWCRFTMQFFTSSGHINWSECRLSVCLHLTRVAHIVAAAHRDL